MNEQIYKDTAKAINQELGRKAVSVEYLMKLVQEAKKVRRTRGTQGLIEFGSKLPTKLFSENEINKLQRSPQYRSTMSKMVDLLVYESVINPFEAMLLKRYI
ncbi:hypothetical protein [Risungbinella massiliensis]|uniref:hypothetical protein n=1 Tax=Risungbinella massiliensis TaxID=1329796 RepID=UPI0005CC2D8B|nr:hypothetical protein [Risungbinella massiliensis]